MSTIRQVAAHAGVSIATVSAVMNDRKYVSPELTERVRKACQELDYHPNALAKALYQRRSHMIAYLVPSIANPGFSKSLCAIESVAAKRGYVVFVANTYASPERADAYLKRLFEMRVDGVIISLTWELVRPDFVHRLLDRGVHVVGISSAREIPEIDCFLGDEKSAGRDLGRYLISLGHTRCAYIAPNESAIGMRRLAGLQQAYQHAQLEIPPALIVGAPSYDEKGGATAVQELLARAEPFTALVAFNDLLATAALGQLISQGFAVPEDVSVATFGDSYARLTQPPLTTMAYPEDEAGTLAATALLDRIEGKRDTAPIIYSIPIKMIIRGSTRTLRSRDRSRLIPASAGD